MLIFKKIKDVKFFYSCGVEDDKIETDYNIFLYNIKNGDKLPDEILNIDNIIDMYRLEQNILSFEELGNRIRVFIRYENTCTNDSNLACNILEFVNDRIAYLRKIISDNCVELLPYLSNKYYDYHGELREVYLFAIDKNEFGLLKELMQDNDNIIFDFYDYALHDIYDDNHPFVICGIEKSPKGQKTSILPIYPLDKIPDIFNMPDYINYRILSEIYTILLKNITQQNLSLDVYVPDEDFKTDVKEEELMLIDGTIYYASTSYYSGKEDYDKLHIMKSNFINACLNKFGSSNTDIVMDICDTNTFIGCKKINYYKADDCEGIVAFSMPYNSLNE